MVLYLDPVIKTLVAAFAQYQRKNLSLLYNVIATLAKSVGNEPMNKPEYINLLLPPLVTNQALHMPQDDGDLVKCMENLHWIVWALRRGFGVSPFSEGVLRPCIWILNQHQVKDYKKFLFSFF